jgi:hypothetical protein
MFNNPFRRKTSPKAAAPEIETGAAESSTKT